MTVRVVASVIQRKGKLLLCKRPAHKRHGGLWEFPGGKIEEGESVLDAVRRELDEELGVEVDMVGAVGFSVADPGSHFHIEFFPTTIHGEPQCIEHEALSWVAEDELLSLPLAPSDRSFVLHLQNKSAANPDRY